MPPLAKWTNVSRQFSNSNTESPTAYRRNLTGTEAMGLVANRLYKTSGYRGLINSGNEIGVAIKNAFVGDNAALGSIFEDEAVIIPNPQIPLRLKDADFFTKNNSANGSRSGLREILEYGGGFTSLRLRTTGVPGVVAAAGKGFDIEIDYTVINPVAHIIHLIELKKGLGAQKKGDAIQLIRASQVLAYHYSKVHPGKTPKFKFYFVAGDALDPANIVFYANGQPPNLFQVLTAKGFAQLVGMDADRILRIMRIRPQEQKKYTRVLLALEELMLSGSPSETTVHYIPELIKRLPASFANKIPEWMEFTGALSDRVARLKALDDIGPLVFKKRLLSKALRSENRSMGSEEQLFSEWLGCVHALSENIAVREDKREKYKKIMKFTKGVPWRPQTFTLAEKLMLRAVVLGDKRYKMNDVANSEKRSGNWYTDGEKIKEMKNSLNALMRGEGASKTRNKLKPFQIWVKRFSALPISATSKTSASYKRLATMAENFARVVTTRGGGAANGNGYEGRIINANNKATILQLLGNIGRNSKLSANRKSALKKLLLLRNQQLTQITIARQRQQAGVAANNGGAGPSRQSPNRRGGAARQASPPKPKGGNNQMAKLTAMAASAKMTVPRLKEEIKKMNPNANIARLKTRNAAVNEYVSKSLAAR